MIQENRQHLRGQSMVIYAVLMVVFIALAALVIDGGFSLAKRRQAQNAADAGALAGADALCAGDPVTAEAVALDYAINRNGAVTADVTMTDRVITVTTTIPHDTFLAGIFGSDVVTTTALASAGCYVPCKATVLPVAWSCQEPDFAGGTITDTCGIQYGTMSTPGPLYVVMDTPEIDETTVCWDPPNIPGYGIDCDWDNDGENDLAAGGNRAWLNLDGGATSNDDLVGWISGELPAPDIFPHYWYGGTPGDKEKAYQEALNRIDDIVQLPVFDRLCPFSGLPEDECPTFYDPGDVTVESSAKGYYRVIGYSAFRITCVYANPDFGGECSKHGYTHDGRDGAIQTLIDQGILSPHGQHTNTKTIEGYFVKDYVGSGKCEGLDTGAYTIYLNH